MTIDFTHATWINPPTHYAMAADAVQITTAPGTDFWQRTYYGFRNENAPALLIERADNFTFTVQASFAYQGRYDQCGIAVYIDGENWFKASIEYERADFSRLGSVVTNRGYSDWATADIPTPREMWYRLSRRGPDFLLESSPDGRAFRQMRVFHLDALGETTEAMGQLDPPADPERGVRLGLYACSPLDSSFTATFRHMQLEPCRWKAHG